MAQDYKLLLQANLDATSLQKQITAIQKNYKFELKVQLDFGDIDKQIQAFKSQWGQIQKQLAQITNPGSGAGGKTSGGGTPSIIPITSLAKDVADYDRLMDRIKQINAEVGKDAASFKMRTVFDEKTGEQIVQAQISYNDALGKSRTETYRLLQVEKDINGEMKKVPEWTQTSNSYNDSLDRRNRILQNNVDYANKFLERAKDLQKTADVRTGMGLASQIKDAAAVGNIEKVNALRKELENLDATIRQSGVSAYSWTKEIGIALKRTVEWSLSVGLVYGAFNQLKEGIQYIKDLNKELVNIQVVGGYTNKEMDIMANGFNKLARELGASTKEVANGSLEWIRQGKNIEETQELMRSTMMMSKLGALESAEATQYLTSILNGFKMEAKDSMDVVDKLVAVDNVAATSVSEMATALQRTANMAQESGVGFDKLVGYIATVSSTTRKSASTIGESFKTMFARLEAIKLGNLDEQGKSISDVEKALGRIGIAIRKDDQTFRNMGDVLDDLAAKWSTLSDVDRRAAAQTIGGVRQYENLLALMENYDKARELERVSAESAGLAEERYSIYLEGVEAAQNKVTASWEKLWMTTLSSDSIKAWYALANGILQVLNNAGGLVPVVGVLTGVFIAFSGTQIVAGASSLTKSISTLFATIRAGFLSTTTSAAGATAAASTFTAAMGVLGIALVAVSAGYMIYQANVKSTEEKLAEFTEQVDRNRDALEKSKNSQKRVAELGEKFEALKVISDKTNTQQQEFIDIQNELKTLLPQIAGYYDTLGDFHLEDSINLAKLNDESQRQVDLQKAQLQFSLNRSIETRIKNYNEELKEVEKLNKKLKYMQYQAKGGELATSSEAAGYLPGITERELELQNMAIQEQRILLDGLAQTFVDDYGRMDEAGQQYLLGQLALQGEEGKIIAERIRLAYMLKVNLKDAFTLPAMVGPEFPPIQVYKDYFESVKKEVDTITSVIEKSQEGTLDLSGYSALLSLGSEYTDLITQENGVIVANEDALRRMQVEKLNAILASREFKNATEEEKLILEATVAEIEKSVPLSTQYVDTFTQIISGVAEGNVKFLELGQRLGETNRSFEQGILTSGQYFEQLEVMLDEVDFSTMFADDKEGAESFFAGLVYNSSQAFSQISSMFDAGKISITDYTYELSNLSDVFGIVGEMFSGYADNLGVAEESQGVVAESLNSMTSATEDLRSLQETNILVQDAYIESMAGTLQFGTDAYNESMRLIADAAYSSGQAWVDTEGNALTSADSIYNHLIATNGNFETFANQTANKTGNTIEKVANAIGTLLVELGNSIKNFKGNIKFTPKITGKGVNWGALLKGDIKNVLDFTMDLGVSGEGFNFAGIGESIAKFGESLKSEDLEFNAKIYTEPADSKRKETSGTGTSKPRSTGSGSSKAQKEEIKSVEDLLKIVVAKIKQQKEAEKDALKETLEAYKESYEERKKIVKDLYDSTIERLKKEIERYKEIIESRKELLRSMKEESDYNKEMAQKEKGLSNTQSEILKLRLDDSEEAKARLLQLQEEEQKQLEDIRETQDDKNYNDQIDALDNEYELFEKSMKEKIELEEKLYKAIMEQMEREYKNFETIIESGIDGIEKYLDKSGQIMNDAMEIVDNKAEGLYQDLINWNNQYGDGVEANVTQAWNDAYTALNRYRNELGQMDSQYVLSVLAKSVIPEYHTGGIVEGKSGQERFAKLMAGEVVVTQSQMEKFMKYTLPSIAKTKSTMASTGNIKFDNLLSLNIQGNMDSSVIPTVEKVVNQAVEKLNKFMLSRGHIRNASQFGN